MKTAMAEEKLLTIREVASILGISEKKVMELAEKGSIPAYKVGGAYLRFKPKEVEQFKESFKRLPDKVGSLRKEAWSPGDSASEKYSFKDRFSDFFYFNDFYILSILIIILLLVIIFRGY